MPKKKKTILKKQQKEVIKEDRGKLKGNSKQ